MADMLTIATLSTNAYKKALEVTSHNVANVGTEGYTRQRVEFGSNAPGTAGGVFQGSGVKVTAVERTYAQYIQSQLYTTGTMVEKFDTQLGLASQVEGVVASNDEGVLQFMQRYFDSLQNLADNPISTTNRQMVMDEAGNLEGHIGNLTNVLDDIQLQTNAQLSDVVNEINSRLEMLQKINTQVEYAANNTSNPPNDLLDKRDQAVLELSEYIDVKAYYGSDGSLSIYAGNGRLPLISGNTVTKLEASPSEYTDENRTEIYLAIGDQKTKVSNFITGGQLGGVLDFRRDMLDKAQKDLGLMLNGMTASTNWQHYQGYDINGDHGGDFFEPLVSNSIASSYNDPSSSNGITVSFRPSPLSTDGAAPYFSTDANLPPYTAATEPAIYGDKVNDLDIAMQQIGKFEPKEYELKYNSVTTSFDIFEKDGDTLLGSVGNAPASSTVIDGLTFATDGGTYVQGDSFIVKPHQDMLDQFSRKITNTDELATRGQSPADTDGDGSILDEATAIAAVGDNVNVANMASLQSKKVLFSDANNIASESLMGGYSQMATNIGTYVRGTDIQLTAQQNVHAQVLEQRESYSGVSLDEEASNLIRYQQAYEASAQIISTYQQIFQTLLGLARG